MIINKKNTPSKSGDLMLRKFDDLELRKIDDFKFAIYKRFHGVTR